MKVLSQLTGTRFVKAATLGLLLSACSSIPVNLEVNEDYEFDVLSTYSLRVGDIDALENEELNERVTAALRTQLDARGYEEVGEDESDFIVEHGLSIEIKGRALDPYFTAPYTAEQYENGHMTIRMLDGLSEVVVWEAESLMELRTVARLYGLYPERVTETNEERDWHIEKVVPRMLDSFPRRRN